MENKPRTLPKRMPEQAQARRLTAVVHSDMVSPRVAAIQSQERFREKLEEITRELEPA